MPPQSVVRTLISGNPAGLKADLYPPGQVAAYDAYIARTSTYPPQPPVPSRTITAQANAIDRWFQGTDPAGRKTTTISISTLIADGAQDRIVAAANDRTLAKLIPAARLLLYPDAGHALLFQPSTRFVLEVQSFLNRRSARRQFLARTKRGQARVRGIPPDFGNLGYARPLP